MRRLLALFCLFTLTPSWANTPSTAPDKPVDKVLVVKSERKLLLIEQGKIIKSYRISLGKQPTGAKLREGDKEAKRDLQAAEKSLADLDKTLSQNSGTGFYTAQGNVSAESIGTFTSVPPVLSGNAVDISV